MSLTLITITAQYINADGTIPKGNVSFQLQKVLRDSTDKLIITTVPIVRTLDSSGMIPQPFQLYADDDSVVLPAGVTYIFQENIVGGEALNLTLNVTHLAAGGAIDLSQVT